MAFKRSPVRSRLAPHFARRAPSCAGTLQASPSFSGDRLRQVDRQAERSTRSVVSRVEGPLFNEAKVVAPWVDHVEGPLTPRTLRHLSRLFTVDLVGGERVERLRPPEYIFNVRHSEV